MWENADLTGISTVFMGFILFFHGICMVFLMGFKDDNGDIQYMI